MSRPRSPVDILYWEGEEGEISLTNKDQNFWAEHVACVWPPCCAVMQRSCRLPTEDIMDLLNLCLTSTYFQYNGKHYKQFAWNSHGVARFCRCRNATRGGTRPCDLQTNNTALVTLR